MSRKNVNNINNNPGSVVRLLITSFGILLLGFSSAIVAQDSVGIEEVVVTAQRREQNLQDVPISISAFNADAVESFMFQDVTDYLVRTPNAAWTSVGSKSRRELAIRGATNLLNVNRTMRPSTFAFYLDDFSIIGSSGNPPILDVERIEVLRGPQATYFGRNALAGGISITSKKPHNDLAGSVMVDYSRFDTKDVEAIVNLPIVKDVLAVRGNIKYTESDGNIKNINPIGGGNDSEYKYARSIIRFTPTENLTVDITGTLVSEKAGMREGVPSGVFSNFGNFLFQRDSIRFPDANNDGIREPLHDGVGFYPENRNRVNFDHPQNVGTNYRMITGRVDYELGDVLFTSISGYINSDFYLNGDVDGASIDAWNEFRNIERDSFSQEIRIQNTNEGRFQWNIGALYADDNGHIRSKTFTGRDNGFGAPAGIAVSDGNDFEGIETWGVFGQFDAEFTENLTISLGGRYSEETMDADVNYLAATFRQIATVKQKFTNFSPRFSVNYGVTDDINLYGTISKGFKSAGINTDAAIISLETGSEELTRFFKPETMWNYELGVKADLFDNRLRLNASVFYMKWTDMQADFLQFVVIDGALAGFDIVSNAESAISKGVEFSLTALPIDNFRVNLDIGYLSAKFDEAVIFIEGQNNVLDGERTPLAPEWTLAADAEYMFNISPNFDGFAQLEWTYRDGTKTNVAGLIHEGFPYEVPSYDFFNLRAGIRHKNFTITGYAENLFDSNYYPNAYVKAWASGMSVEPSFRTYGIRMRYTYGE